MRLAALAAKGPGLTWTKVVFPEPAMPSTMRHTGLSPAAAPGTPLPPAVAELPRVSGKAASVPGQSAAAAMMLEGYYSNRLPSTRSRCRKMETRCSKRKAEGSSMFNKPR